MRWRSTVGVVLAAVLAAPVTLAAQDTRPGVAVLPFHNGGSYGREAEDFEALSVGLQQILMTEFALNSNLRIVDRADIKRILEELQLSRSEQVDANTAAKVGKLVGARFVIAGGFVDWYGDMRIDARVVNVETSELVKANFRRDKRDAMYPMIVGLANEVTKDLSLPQLSHQAFEQRQERSQRIDPEAVRLYTKALLYADRGDTAKARELFSRISSQFPEYTEAQEALKQLPAGP